MKSWCSLGPGSTPLSWYQVDNRGFAVPLDSKGGSLNGTFLEKVGHFLDPRQWFDNIKADDSGVQGYGDLVLLKASNNGWLTSPSTYTVERGR